MRVGHSGIAFGALTLLIVFSMGVPAVADFTLVTSPDSQAVCTGDNAVYLVDIGSTLGFSDPVTLSSSGQPAGTTASFSTNPVSPPGSSSLTISNTGAAAAGSYLITVTGLAPTSTHTSTVGLDVFDSPPGPVSLSSPPNGASDVPRLPTLSWGNAAQASSYNLEIALDAGFGSLVVATTATAPAFDVANPLQQNTTYYWRVQPGNSCGSPDFSSAFSFTTGYSLDGRAAPIPVLSTTGMALLLIILVSSGLFLIRRNEASR